MIKEIPKVLVYGSIGIDTIETPYGKEKDILGGSATYASLAASYLSQPIILATCGTDVTKNELNVLEKNNIITDHLLRDGKTLRWHGQYNQDGNVQTISTQLDGLTDKIPTIPKNPPKFLLLGNHNPDFQLGILKQLPKDTFTIADTIELWINTKHEKVKQVLSRVDAVSITDAEAKMLAGTQNTILAGKFMLSLNPKSKFVVIKKGEHGALTFFKNGSMFFSPGYPLEVVKDPTGAGDSLAGGLLSYLAYLGKTDEKTVKDGIIYGSMISSFVAENIGTKYREVTSYNNIIKRVGEVKKMIMA